METRLPVPARTFSRRDHVHLIMAWRDCGIPAGVSLVLTTS